MSVGRVGSSSLLAPTKGALSFIERASFLKPICIRIYFPVNNFLKSLKKSFPFIKNVLFCCALSRHKNHVKTLS